MTEDIDYLKESRNLREAAKKQLSLALKEAQKRKVTITAKPRKGSIYIVDYFKDIRLLKDFISEYKEYFPGIASHSKIEIKNIAELIYSNGGVKKTLNNLNAYLYEIKISNFNYEKRHYAYEIFHVCMQISAYVTKKYSHFTLPYCALCWRRIEDSRYYCEIHHPKQSPNTYYSSKAALFRAIKNGASTDDSELRDEFEHEKATPQLMYKWIHSFAPRYGFINKKMKEVIDPSKDWPKVTSIIIEFCKSHYPMTYGKICNIEPKDSWAKWCLEIIRNLDSTEASYWESKDSDWLKLDEKIPAWAVLMAILRRHEATEFILLSPKRTGPKPGTVPKNFHLREQVSALANQQKALSRINGAKIAKILNISRERANKLIKELGLR